MFPRRGWRERWLESNRPGRWFLCRGAERILRTRIPEEMPAPAEMLQALRDVAFQSGDSPGLDFERQAASQTSSLIRQLSLLRYAQSSRNAAAPGISSSGKHPGYAHHRHINGDGGRIVVALLPLVTKGYEVVLRAENELALGGALSQIVQLLQAEVQRGGMTAAQFQKMLAAIRGTYTWTHFDKLDMLLDTTPGSLDEKRTFFREVEEQVPPTTLLTPITGLYRAADLQQGLTHPERLVVVNVIEPWNRGSVVEIATPSSGRFRS